MHVNRRVFVVDKTRQPVIIRILQGYQEEGIIHNILMIKAIKYLEFYKYKSNLSNMPKTCMISLIITGKNMSRKRKQS